ncbi:hypothetical protein D3C84_969620 [compost metagenome]
MQVLDDAHALDQLLATRLELTDLLDPLIDHDDLFADVIVARNLSVDGGVDGLIGDQYRACRPHQHADQNQ